MIGKALAGLARQLMRQKPEQRRIGTVDRDIVERAVLDERGIAQIIDPRARRSQECALPVQRVMLQPPDVTAAAILLPSCTWVHRPDERRDGKECDSKCDTR